jgi:hypothetical protein
MAGGGKGTEVEAEADVDFFCLFFVGQGSMENGGGLIGCWWAHMSVAGLFVSAFPASSSPVSSNFSKGRRFYPMKMTYSKRLNW